MNSLYFLVAAIVVLVVLASIARRVIRVRTELQRPAKPDYTVRKSVLSTAERSFAGVLESMLPPDVRVLFKVQLAAVFVARVGLDAVQRSRAWNRISQNHVDFLLVRSGDLAPLGAIQLEDSAHDYAERQERVQFLNDVFHACDLPVLHVPAKPAYDPAALRVQVEAITRPREP